MLDFQQVTDDVCGVSKFGKTNLIFVNPGVKIYYYYYYYYY